MQQNLITAIAIFFVLMLFFMYSKITKNVPLKCKILMASWLFCVIEFVPNIFEWLNLAIVGIFVTIYMIIGSFYLFLIVVAGKDNYLMNDNKLMLSFIIKNVLVWPNAIKHDKSH